MIIQDGKKSFPHLNKQEIRSNYLTNNKRNSFRMVIEASYVRANKQDMEDVNRRLARFQAGFRWVQLGRENNCRTDDFWKLESVPEWAGTTINCSHNGILNEFKRNARKRHKRQYDCYKHPIRNKPRYITDIHLMGLTNKKISNIKEAHLDLFEDIFIFFLILVISI